MVMIKLFFLQNGKLCIYLSISVYVNYSDSSLWYAEWAPFNTDIIMGTHPRNRTKCMFISILVLKTYSI